MKSFQYFISAVTETSSAQANEISKFLSQIQVNNFNKKAS